MSEATKTKTDEAIDGYIEVEREQDWSKPCDEMVELRRMLDEAGIGWHEALTGIKARNRFIWDTTSDAMAIVMAGERATEFRAFVVRWSMFSYGGDEGLLEVTAFDHGPIGNLTAKGAFEACRLACVRANGTRSGEGKC